MSRCLSLSTMVDVLRMQASAIGDQLAFRFLVDHSGEESTLTFGALHERAMAIGGELQTLSAQGERALLVFPPGLGFIEAFFGCLYAGIVAVPAAPPSRNRATSSIEAIFHAAKPSLILSTAAHHKLAVQTYSHCTELFQRPWIATDHVDDDRRRLWRDPNIDGGHTAFLQYTSGSTTSPKGVVLSHGNLLYNAALIQEVFGNTPDGSGVCWLPLYHDMGLIGGVVQPIYCGGPCTHLAPASFLQRPALWLETISRIGGTVSGGPDFAYDLCARKISAEERQQLDLSTWEVAFTGAERVRAETIDHFCEVFGPCGFRREAFFPCYGLAEATLMVSGGPRLTRPVILRVEADALSRGQVQEVSHDENSEQAFVACGECMPGHKNLIVDPATRLACADGNVGEIWVQGPSVAGGYYGLPEATEVAFDGRLADTGEGPFLRTGDLGFLREGQLFVTGRLKDVIIVRGRNYYPEDIERVVERAHTAFRAGFCAAFSVNVDDWDRPVVVQEIEPRRRDLDLEEALAAVRRVVAAEHELEVHAVVLAKAGEIPKTSSGKTRRSACRERYRSGQMKILAQWQANDQPGLDEAVTATSPRSVTAAEVENWLRERIAARLQLPVGQVGATTPFLDFGMGSVDAVEITADLERWLGRRLSPTAIYNYPNIDALANWLASPPLDPQPSTRLPEARIPVDELDSQRLLDDVRRMTEDEMQAFILQEMAKQ